MYAADWDVPLTIENTMHTYPVWEKMFVRNRSLQNGKLDWKYMGFIGATKTCPFSVLPFDITTAQLSSEVHFSRSKRGVEKCNLIIPPGPQFAVVCGYGFQR